MWGRGLKTMLRRHRRGRSSSNSRFSAAGQGPLRPTSSYLRRGLHDVLQELVQDYVRAQQDAGRSSRYALNTWWGIRSFLAHHERRACLGPEIKTGSRGRRTTAGDRPDPRTDAGDTERPSLEGPGALPSCWQAQASGSACLRLSSDQSMVYV